MFETYGHEKILEKHPISSLENSILAIDGYWYIKKYLSISNEEQFLNVSTSLDGLMKNLVELNKKTSILWVWDGIELKMPFTTDLASFCRDISNKIIFSKFNKRIYDQEMYAAVMTHRLREAGISVMRAPYAAAAQCAYFMKNCKTHAFGKNDALLFADCNRLIVDIDYESSTIDVIDREVLFRECNLNLESFRRLALLSGCEYCATYPIFANDFDPLKAIELLKRNTVADESAKGYEMFPDSKYFQDYQQGFSIIESHAVMGLNGTVHIPDQKVGADTVNEIFGCRLPGRVYAEIFKCKIGAKTIGNKIFNRKRSYIVARLLETLEQLLDNPKSIDAPKGTALSELFMKRYKVDLVWHPTINRAVQLLFHIFLDEGVEPVGLLKFVNSGVICTRATLPEVSPSERLVHYSTKYLPETLEQFCVFMENQLLFKDVAALANIGGGMQNDVQFELSLGDFTSKMEKPVIKQFLTQNISNSKRLDQFLKLLEAQS